MAENGRWRPASHCTRWPTPTPCKLASFMPSHSSRNGKPMLGSPSMSVAWHRFQQHVRSAFTTIDCEVKIAICTTPPFGTMFSHSIAIHSRTRPASRRQTQEEIRSRIPSACFSVGMDTVATVDQRFIQLLQTFGSNGLNIVTETSPARR